MGPDELFQRAVIARRYYLEGRTRVEIAEEFGLSRFKVARMLEEALESGMVEITIHDPGAIDVELSSALQKRYSLQHAYAVVAQSKNTADRVEAVAKAMADLLHSVLRKGDVIGIDCGRTMTRIAPYLHDLPRCDVVQLTGLAGGLTSNGADLTRRITEVTGGKSWPLYAPYVVADARTARSLASTSPIKDAFANHSRVTCALVSVGGWTAEASQVYTSVPEDEAAELYEAGVRAETCGLLLDENGRRIAGLDERRMGITEQGLRAIPTVIAICAGAEKIVATRAVLRSGLISALVTDTEIAAAVLDSDLVPDSERTSP
ncbi:DNA-binding transcriptional regulator [Mycolicibacterium obuense]|uniref:DNA-binding transcriptional regulator n=1 Tax=Mycolicibacterium obuense TaxID=1807 RepID=A0A0J6VJJ5_9MYCO|nr:sugar-binding domain-containing protein [Mycolicibacterium obuense]KKF00273.1 DeoR faimly transcriptional regulator [Mycolicibacterium obuense]KMO69618.1 Transcriptional regulator LsrR [Mycolicibacterium obuense]OKH67603.1 DeoR family transcriptional regulator [Mycobacterium sp. SWH-M1]TDL11598.1 DNA-binding transcriptional regulator [Mycolicibacterium obuense]